MNPHLQLYLQFVGPTENYQQVHTLPLEVFRLDALSSRSRVVATR